MATTPSSSSMPVPNSIESSPSGVLQFAHLLQQLKIFKRTGWLNKGIPFEKTESIGDHMYRMGILAMTIKDDQLDMNKCLKMALVHDLAEAITTDLTPESGYSAIQKHQLELDAMSEIERILQGNPFGREAKELWLEYSADETREANFVKDLDKLELLIQVSEYEKETEIRFDDWVKVAAAKIRHAQLQELRDQVLNERESIK